MINRIVSFSFCGFAVRMGRALRCGRNAVPVPARGSCCAQASKGPAWVPRWRGAVPQPVSHLCLFHTTGKIGLWIFFVTVPSATFRQGEGGTWPFPWGLTACGAPLPGHWAPHVRRARLRSRGCVWWQSSEVKSHKTRAAVTDADDLIKALARFSSGDTAA